MSEEELKINVSGFKDSPEKIFGFLKNKKVQFALIAIFLIAILIFGTLIRIQNVHLLKDQTTGEYIPTALDPFYFLRIAETIVEEGGLPEVDNFRIIEGGVGFIPEIYPSLLVYMYKIANLFGEYSLQYIDVLSPVIFFGAGIIVFFFLVWVLTNSKITAAISTAFLSVIPPYLYRSSAGFADHDILGMFAFFSVLLGYGIFLKKLDKEKISLKNSVLFGLLIGILSSFTIASWGGIAKFVFIIIPVSFLILWLMKSKNFEEVDEEYLKNLLVFYSLWIFISIFSGLIYGFGLKDMVGRVALSSTNVISSAVFLFFLVDFFMIKFKEKIKYVKQERLEKFRILYSLLIIIILGFIFLIFTGNLFSVFSILIDRFIHPFGAGRTGLTVAENAQPYLSDWIDQVGKKFFWFFYLGMILVGFKISKGINEKKSGNIFLFLWFFMISGILFSRISSESVFNGTNFISMLFYFGGMSLFVFYSLWVYLNKEIKINTEYILISVWLILMVVAGRSATRVLFVITPFACMMGGYAITSFVEYSSKTKDELMKIILTIIVLILIVSSIFSFVGFASSSVQQAKYLGPSANIQWQKAMQWVRENTPENSIFVHWWDYGYWVQYLGKRATIADGGHFQGDFRDHLIGRYLLTTTRPEVALSFMKSNNIDYLLIDPTDLGKYGAYSRIGSDDSGEDRFSQAPIIPYNNAQSRINDENETRAYIGGVYVDEDITYGEGENKIFLPKNKAVMQGILISSMKKSGSESFSQPKGIFIYNNQQIVLPIRYLYYKNQIIDFGGGFDAVIRLIPSITQSKNNVNIDHRGAIIYLSPKVSKSLFSQIYLLDDSFKNYPSIKVAHSEQDPIIAELNSQGANLGEFAFFNGFRGPIKIWEIEYPNNIVINKEFTNTSGKYAELDNLKFSS